MANDFLGDGRGLAAVGGLRRALRRSCSSCSIRSRHKAGLATDPILIVALRIGGPRRRARRGRADRQPGPRRAYAAVIVGVLLVFWTYVLNRTRYGRHVYAVGGNAEAARRAGINVDRVKIACFMICSGMAVLGGILLASRLRSVDTGTGGGQVLLYPIAAAVIGGTSLFGGRGTMKAALLGALVMIGIDNGLGLLGLSSGTKFVVTGGVLLLAVTVDSISRRGRAQSGRA